MAEEVLWAHLVTRDDPTTAAKWGSGATLRVVSLEDKAGVQSLEAKKEGAIGEPLLTVILQLSNYWIRSLTWGFLGSSHGNSEKYTDTIEDQAEAVDAIKEFLRDKEAEKEVKFCAGPVRIEIEFSSLTFPEKLRSGVVISCLPPAGTFKDYHCQVREWYEKSLTTALTSINEHTHRILSVYKIHGTQTSAELSLHVPQSLSPMESFRRLGNVWEDFQPDYRSYAANWIPVTNKTSCQTDGYSHYNNFYNSGAGSKPEPALMRKAGDDLGIKNFLAQEERSQNDKKHLWGLQEVAPPTESEKSTTSPIHQYGTEYYGVD